MVVKKIDYYAHWNTKRTKEDVFIKDREKKTFQFIEKIGYKKSMNLLDVGCGYGRYLSYLRKEYDYMNLYGVEISKEAIKEGREMGLNIIYSDLDKGIDFKDRFFDVINAAEVIEHVYSPDDFLFECNRVLKDDGYLIITTPNLCAWFNRLLMLFGSQPLFLEPSTKSKLIGSGFLKRFKKDSTPVGHIRVLTMNALKDLLEESGFEIIKIEGAIYDEALPKSMWFFDDLFTGYPKLSSQFVILAKKKRRLYVK